VPETVQLNVEFTQGFGYPIDTGTLKRTQYIGKDKKQGKFSAVQLLGT
jgi:hypothetical protein